MQHDKGLLTFRWWKVDMHATDLEDIITGQVDKESFSRRIWGSTVQHHLLAITDNAGVLATCFVVIAVKVTAMFWFGAITQNHFEASQTGTWRSSIAMYYRYFVISFLRGTQERHAIPRMVSFVSSWCEKVLAYFLSYCVQYRVRSHSDIEYIV